MFVFLGKWCIRGLYVSVMPVFICSFLQANNNKWLSDFGIRNGSRLQADDFLQDYTLLVNVLHTYVLCFSFSFFFTYVLCFHKWYEKDACLFVDSEELERDVEFEVIGEAPDKAPPPQTNQEEVNNIANGNKDSSNQQSTSAEGQSSSPHFSKSLNSRPHILGGSEADTLIFFCCLRCLLCVFSSPGISSGRGRGGDDC